MHQFKFFCVLFLNVILFCGSLLPVVFAQDSKTALFRGYRTGYSDGYMAGYRDASEKLQRNIEKHQDYAKADRAFLPEYGSLEDYRNGYQQGFEIGYTNGFDRLSFDSTIPASLEKRGGKPVSPTIPNSDEVPVTTVPVQTGNVLPTATSDALIVIPANTELIVEMENTLNTKDARKGDAFRARIIAPVEIEGALVEGRVTDLQKPGRIKRRAEMQLSFDRILLNQNRWSNLNAMVVEAFPSAEKTPKNNVKTVNSEGTVQGKSSLKSDVIIVGSAAGTGGTIGAIAGGPVGFAVGAAVGGAFGLGGVLVARGKDIQLNEGQRLRIRTAYETQIR
ncbi:MAG: hypothetical protein M3209_11835 [Acidobacteriota bacterium]|nr:hypothetical protein [Acidobacteriota bacterium]